jgi:diketogulonate reductase-like aldo/keto reductase
MGTANIVPAVNQIMLHPYNLSAQASTLEYCAKHGIVVEAFSSLMYVFSFRSSVKGIRNVLGL